MRVKRPFVFTNLKSGEGVDQIAKFVIEEDGLAKSAAFPLDPSIGNHTGTTHARAQHFEL